MLGPADGDEEVTLLGDKDADGALLGKNDRLGDDDDAGSLLGNTESLGDNDCEGALLGNDDGVTDGRRMLGPADGDEEVTLLGDKDADGAYLARTTDSATMTMTAPYSATQNH